MRIELVLTLLSIFMIVYYIYINTKTLLEKDHNKLFEKMKNKFDNKIKTTVEVQGNELELSVFPSKLLGEANILISLVNKKQFKTLVSNISAFNRYYDEEKEEFLIYSKHITQKEEQLDFTLKIWLTKTLCIRYEFIEKEQ
jgi:hypothetical protein